MRNVVEFIFQLISGCVTFDHFLFARLPREFAMNDPQEVYGNVSALCSLLDRIDSKKVPRTNNAGDVALSRTAAALATKPAQINLAAQPIVLWHEFIDASSGKSYYHNYETKETTWEKPTTFIPAIPVATVASIPVTSHVEIARSSSTADDYRATGFFNAKDGRYTGQSSRHFTQVMNSLLPAEYSLF